PTPTPHAASSTRVAELTTMLARAGSARARGVAMLSDSLSMRSHADFRASLVEPLLTTEAISHATPSRRAARGPQKREEPADLSNFDCQTYLESIQNGFRIDSEPRRLLLFEGESGR